MRIVDLSVPIEAGCISEEVPSKIKYINHKIGGRLLGMGVIWKGNNLLSKILNFIVCVAKGELITCNDFIDKKGLSTEIIKLSTHTGTHIDSPYHYSEKNGDFSSISLENFYGDGFIFDFSSRCSEEPITVLEIVEKLNNSKCKLKKGDIVLFYTGASHLWNSVEYKEKYVGLTMESVEFLLDKEVSIIGTDAFGLDQPFDYMCRKYKKSSNKLELWPAHMYGRKRPYLMIEKLTNLDKVGRLYGFKIVAFPVYIKGASAGWSRVVAIIEDEKEDECNE